MSFLESIDKNRLQKILIVTIAALVLALLVCLVVIIIFGINPPSQKPNDTNFELNDYVLTDKDVNTGSLLLVDADHPYTPSAELVAGMVGCQSYRNENRGTTEKGPYYCMNNVQLSPAAIAAAHDLLVAAEKSVKEDDLLVKYAYDGDDGQTAEYKTGLLMFLTNYDEEKLPENYAKWIDDNAAKYGFIESFEDAYRYVGEVHAKYMTEEKVSLADYINFLKKNTHAEKAITVKLDGVEYAVYYAEGKAGDTIKVPATAEYTVSGTNEGGVIVTVKNAK